MAVVSVERGVAVSRQAEVLADLATKAMVEPEPPKTRKGFSSKIRMGGGAFDAFKGEPTPRHPRGAA